MASNASSSRKEGRAPCSFKSLEGRSSKATGPSTTTTATEDRSLSLSLSSQQTRALSSSNSFPKSRASPSRACPTKSHDYPGQAAERQEEHGKEQSAGRGAKGPKTSTGLQREGEGKKPKCLLEWEGIISPLSLACVKSHGPAGAARALRAPTVAPLVDGRAATVPRAKAILERRGGGGVGRRRRRKTRERLSAKIVQSRESEREKKKKKKKSKSKKERKLFPVPVCASVRAHPLCTLPSRDKGRVSEALACDPPRALLPREQQQKEGPRAWSRQPLLLLLLRDAVLRRFWRRRKRRRLFGYRSDIARIPRLSPSIASPPAPGVGPRECSQQLCVRSTE
jgi:hypothetical protein